MTMNDTHCEQTILLTQAKRGAAQPARSAPRWKKVKVSSWIPPLVKAELQRRVERTGLSMSVLIAAILEKDMYQSIETQYATQLEPMLRKIMRDEFLAFGNRIVHFLMIIAFAAEQARILLTNVLERVLLLVSVPLSELDATLQSLVDRSRDTARRNVIEGTAPIKTLIEEWKKRANTEAQERRRRPAHG
jgi:hypothetical protein